MAGAGDDRRELIELLGDVLGVLAAAEGELSAIGEMEIEMPADTRRRLDERDAMAATLKRLPARLRRRAVEVYREELVRVQDDYERHGDPMKVPTDDEVQERIGEVYELLRRKSLYYADLRSLDARYW